MIDYATPFLDKRWQRRSQGNVYCALVSKITESKLQINHDKLLEKKLRLLFETKHRKLFKIVSWLNLLIEQETNSYLTKLLPIFYF